MMTADLLELCLQLMGRRCGLWMGTPVAVGQGQFDLQQGPPSILCEWR